MKYKKMTPHEFARKTVEDITKKRQLEKEGQRQAFIHSMENRDKIQRKISHGRH